MRHRGRGRKAGRLAVGWAAFAPPVADFSGFPTSAVSGGGIVPVAFTDLSTGVVTARLWDFGNGSTSTDQNPTAAYTDGTYTVTLTVTGPGGTDQEVKTNYITMTP